jgi:hypothetical protein
LPSLRKFQEKNDDISLFPQTIFIVRSCVFPLMDNHNMDLPLLLSVLQAGSICLTAVTAVCEAVEEEHHRKRPKTDHRILSRSQRREVNHDDALYSFKRDYLGKREEPTTPLFGAEFTWMFRVSRSRFQVLMEDIMNSQHEFFKPSPQDGHERCSLETKLLFH